MAFFTNLRRKRRNFPSKHMTFGQRRRRCNNMQQNAGKTDSNPESGDSREQGRVARTVGAVHVLASTWLVFYFAEKAGKGQTLRMQKARARETLTLIGNFLSSTLVAFVALLAVVLVVIRALGMQFFTVESGSMSPLYPINSLVVVREVEPETIEVGDVVTYVLNEDLVLVTHRVTEINASERTFTTKGDANTAEDPNPVLWDNVVGKVVLGLPGVGAPVDLAVAQFLPEGTTATYPEIA